MLTSVDTLFLHGNQQRGSTVAGCGMSCDIFVLWKRFLNFDMCRCEQAKNKKTNKRLTEQ